MKKVAIIILNYKLKNQVLECIKSLRESTYKNFSIFVVDNNSGDSLEVEIGQKQEICFIQTGKNLGYAGGNNAGIKKALSENADYILILNPDTIVEPNTIVELVAGIEKYKAGIVCPKIFFGNSKTIWFAGKTLDLKNVLGNHKGVNEEDLGQYDQDEEINDITGAAMMVRAQVFENIGLFDERYFLYYEESDFSYRAKKAGFKLMYIYKAKVFHKNAQATGLGSPLQDYFITRNRLLFASKFLPFRTQFALIREALRNLGNQMRRLALFDFLLGNFGRGSFKI